MSTPTPAPTTDSDPTPTPARRPIRRYVLIAAVLLVLVLAAVAAMGGFTREHHTADRDAPTTNSDNGGLIGTDGGEIPQPISTPTIPTSPTVFVPAFPEPFSAVQPANPVAVMRAAGLTSMFTYFVTDSTQLDAANRAAPLIAPPGVDVGFISLAPITAGQWSQWHRDRNAVTASVTVPARNDNPDTATKASRIASVTQRVVDRRGAVVETLPTLSVYTTATEQPGGQYKISKVTVQQ